MRNIYKSAVLLMLVTIISKIMGFAREVFLASFYGASFYSDAYITAFNVPTLVFIPFATAIGIAVTPLYFDIKKQKGEEYSHEYLNNTINLTLVISFLLICIVLIFPDVIVRILAFGFKGEVFNLTVNYIRIMVFGVAFIGLSNIMTSFLQLKDRFLITGLIGIPYNIILIISIVLSAKYNHYILGAGSLLALASNFLFQYPFAKKEGFTYRPKLNFKDENIKKMLWLVSPVLLGVGVNQINGIIDRTIASTLAEGSISALNYSNRLTSLIIGVLIVPIGAVIYPKLSKISLEDSKEVFNDIISRSVNIVVLLIIPITFGAIILAEPIVKVLFQRGAFDIMATKMTASALLYYSIGLIGFSLRDILGKVYYSLQDTKTPMTNGVIAMILNIILNLILSRYMGHSGIALATSISSIITIILLFGGLKRKLQNIRYSSIFSTLTKSLFSSVIMGITVYYSFKVLNNILTINILSILVSIVIGILVYFITLKILKTKELEDLSEIIKLSVK